MTYKCKICGAELLFMETDGDEISEDFTCQACLEEMDALHNRASEIAEHLLKHLASKQ